MPIIIFICIILFLYWGNNSIVVSKFSYRLNRSYDDVQNIKILHISDFHNKKFGKVGYSLIKIIKEQTPDLIVITGDIIDRRRYNLEVALSLCEHIVKIAPAYYVSGNHEAWSGKYEDIILKLKEVGIKVLEDNSQSIFIRNKKIEIFGIKENSKKSGKLSQETFSALKTYGKYRKNDADLLILLTHRPEHFLTYSSYPFDLIFSGHAHGGQIRLPFIGALFAPDQGFIPKYHGGRYVEDRQTMFLSRGLGNSIFPLRILNRPELILVELSNEYEETSN